MHFDLCMRIWTQRLSLLAASAVVCLSMVVMLGWAAGHLELTCLVPGWPRMVPATALCMLVAGLGVLSSVMYHRVNTSDAASRRRWQTALTVCASIVLLVAGLRLAMYAGMFGFPIDQLPFSADSVELQGGRMSPLTALSFALIGLALLYIRSKKLFGSTIHHGLLILVGLFGWLGISRFIYGGEPLFSYAQMAVHTALGICLIVFGLLFSHCDTGFMRTAVSDTSGGTMIRRMLPVVLVTPVFFGWLRLQGELAGWYGLQAGVSLFAIANVLLFGLLLWLTAGQLRLAELEGRKATEHIANSETLLAQAQELAGIGTLEVRFSGSDTTGASRFWSRQLYRLLGYGPDMRPSFEAFVDRVHPDDRAGLQQLIEESYTRADRYYRCSFRVVRSDGSTRWLEGHTEVTYDIAGRPSRLISNIQDITARHEAELTLQASRELTRAIVANAIDGIVTMEHDGCIVDLNPAAEAIFRIRSDEAAGRMAGEVLIHGEEYRRVLNQERDAGPARVEVIGRRPRGITFPLEISMASLPGAGQRRLVWFVRDITERVEADNRVHVQLARLALLAQITRAIGEHQDLQSIYQVVVRALEDHLPIDFACMCRYDEAEQALTVIRVGVKSATLALDLAMTEQAVVHIDRNGLSRCVRGDLVYEADLAGLDFPFPKRLSSAGLGSMIAAPLIVESRVYGAIIVARSATDGFSPADCEFLRQLSAHVGLVTHQADLYSALLTAYDDLRRTQQTVAQQERLRSIGQMASGMAHDINNALSPIVMCTETLLEHDHGLSPRARRYLEMTRVAANDVAQTVNRLREFSRQRDTTVEKKSTDLNHLVEQVMELTRARWNDMPQERGVVVTPKVMLAKDLPMFLCVAGEIRDALTNLIFNAVDAMPAGGTLSVRTSRVPSPASTDGPSLVRIEIGDTGLGMDAETCKRCLEPFFTTKGERGTGLGLAMVYGAVKRHEGDLQIASTVGEGTTFIIEFPAVAGPQQDSPAAGTLVELRPLRLLVIDDDPLLLHALVATLEGEGHTVVTANGGRAGIDACLDAMHGGKPFDVVLTDLGMPHVDGRVVAQTIKAACPSLPVIMLTGWGQRLREEEGTPTHVDLLLSKPPRMAEIRAALRHLTAS